MMTNLFSIFDPSTSSNVSLNWMSLAMALLVVSSSVWAVSSKTMVFLNTMKVSLFNEFKIILGQGFPKGSLVMLISMFSFILFNNLMGVFPYIFTASSHMSVTLSLALPMWAALMIYGWLNQTTMMFTHLVPQGTPSVLMPFMVLIESISNSIRPFTLAVRLMANMVAGHLLMTLLANQTSAMSLAPAMMLVQVQMILVILELAVSVIQAYVFSVLMTMYASEIHSN